MMGVLWTPKHNGPAFAPSVSAPLYPVAGQPAVKRALSALLRAGSDDVLLLTAADDLREWGERPDVPVKEVTAEPAAVRERADGAHDRVLAVNAAALVEPDALREVAAEAPAVGVRAASQRLDGAGSDSTATNSATGDTASSESAASDGGITATPVAYAGAPSLFESVRDVSELAEIPTNIPEPARVTLDDVQDVRRPWELLAATEAALDEQTQSIDGDVHPDADLRGAVVVESGASVSAGVVVEGPAYLSAESSVGPNAYVRGRTFLGRGAHVGHAVEVKNSVLFAGAKVPHLTYVGDSVVGPDANVGAGSLVANLRHDERDVEVAHDGARVSTNRRKFGAVVGEGAKLGIGTRLNVGVTVGAGATTRPGEVLTRDRGCDAS